MNWIIKADTEGNKIEDAVGAIRTAKLVGFKAFNSA